MTRLPKELYFLQMAFLTSQRSTCSRRQVGCILVDDLNHVLATGYNGVPRDMPHCNEGYPCPGVNAAPGTGLESCDAIHAEQNALLQCPNVENIKTAYCTDSPCVFCVRLLLNTGCRDVIFARDYPHGRSRELWLGHSKSYVDHGLTNERRWMKVEVPGWDNLKVRGVVT